MHLLKILDFWLVKHFHLNLGKLVLEERSSDEHDAREMHVAKKTSAVQQWTPGIKFNKSNKPKVKSLAN